MSKILIATASVLVLALGVAGVQAHQSGLIGWSGPQGHMGQGFAGPGMMTGQGWGAQMMGGMMGSEMMLIMMDADSDGAVSIDEFQALHARMFAAMDADGDGQIEAGELNAFHTGFAGDATN